MFSDFQDFFWIAYGDTVQTVLLIWIVSTVIVAMVVLLDRVFSKFVSMRND